MREAHMGLGLVYLNRGNFSKAREQFQTLLDIRYDDDQAILGRGITLAEEGLLEDPVARKSRLETALSDFESVLKRRPRVVVALYNRILTFDMLGRYKEALRGIDEYISRDGRSIWAEKLRSLRGSILDKE